jgi:hypothetical protein
MVNKEASTVPECHVFFYKAEELPEFCLDMLPRPPEPGTRWKVTIEVLDEGDGNEKGGTEQGAATNNPL